MTFLLQGNIDFFCQKRLHNIISDEFSVEKTIGDVKLLNKETKLTMDDGDTRGGTEEKTQNDSDTGSDE